mgnify:CR=1 FL=1
MSKYSLTMQYGVHYLSRKFYRKMKEMTLRVMTTDRNEHKILKKNKLNIQQLEKANFFSDLSESFTTYRVAKTIVDTINFAIKNQK